VYISLGRYDDAIASANRVINDGIHALMTQRFGRYANQPGDVYSDLFKDFNQNLAANTETIWALQTEFQTPGGGLYRGVRYWNPNFPAVRDPEGQPALQFVDSTNRPQGFLRGTYHAYTGVWMSDWNDMRNSKYNISRVWQYNLPSSNFYGQIVDPTTAVNVDTLANFFPFIRKVEGEAFAGAFSGFVHKDIYMMRLAETYLLRAEAYLLKGDLTNAVNDVNVIRSRANATPATVAEMSMDYILDERIRELLVEEPRRLTLARTNTLVDRVRRFNPFSQGNIKDYHRFFPIPQKAIDANINATLEQNPGYF
jgi:starch-binding outer membrane protein, SusD/RagB family